MTRQAAPLAGVFAPAEVPAGSVVRIRKRVCVQPGGDVSYPVVVVAGASPGPMAALVAGVHGDEYEGPRALWDLCTALDPQRMRGRVVLVPVAHVAAYAAGQRVSPVDGENLGRLFPGDAHGGITARLAHDLFETVVRPADFAVDLHGGGARYAFPHVACWYSGGGDIDAAVAAGSLRLAQDMGLRHLWRMPPRAGALSFEACKAGIAAAGTETGGRGGCLPQDVAACRDGLLRVLARRGVLDAPQDAGAPDHTTTFDGDWLPAPCGGFIEPVAPMGARVGTGEVLARILDVDGTELAVLRAASAGVVMAERHMRVISTGEWATCAVTERPLRPGG